uniref:Uncharacterized protein n=1 Tax=Arundo donax TaxID=35708 RepID=A0A0A9AB03_ARUDO
MLLSVASQIWTRIPLQTIEFHAKRTKQRHQNTKKQT